MPAKQFRSVLLLLLVLSLLLAACGGRSERSDAVAMNQPQPTATSVGITKQANATINVTLQEMTVTLDKTQAPAGTITFVVQNNGHVPHDFAIKGDGVEEKTPQLQPGQSATLTVELAPGDYQYQCTVPGHAIAGMRGTLRVT